MAIDKSEFHESQELMSTGNRDVKTHKRISITVNPPTA